MTKPIKVVDSIMGSYKTSWAIQYMNESEDLFLYVTPYTLELDRVVRDCKQRDFIQPAVIILLR